MKNKINLFNVYLIILGISLSLMTLWGNLKADCTLPFQNKIEQKSNDGVFKKIFYPAQRYQDTLAVILDAIANNPSPQWKKFESDLSGGSNNNRVEVSAGQRALLMKTIRQLNEKKLLCVPKPVTYKELISNFGNYVALLKAELNKPAPAPVDPLSKRKMIIRQLERDYLEVNGCAPYKNEFNSPQPDMKKFAIQGTNPLLFKKVEMEDCPICADEKPAADFFANEACGCQGKACKECVGRTFTDNLKEGGHPQSCLFCKGKLDARELLQAGLLNEEQVVLWKLRELRGAAFSCPEFVPCDSTGCENGFFQGTDRYQKYLTHGCSACGSKAKKCADCGKDTHAGKTCEQVWMERVKECEQLGASACPTCWTAIQHGGACMHMTCPQCKTEYSEITKLPMEKDKRKREKEYDEGGWPLKYFYQGGVYSANGRRDQKNRTIDIYGNLIREIPRPVNVDGRWEYIPTWTVVSRDGKDFFEYDPRTNKAWILDKRNFKKAKEVPQSEFYRFKGEWDQIVQKVKKDQAEARKKRNLK